MSLNITLCRFVVLSVANLLLFLPRLNCSNKANVISSNATARHELHSVVVANSPIYQLFETEMWL